MSGNKLRLMKLVHSALTNSIDDTGKFGTRSWRNRSKEDYCGITPKPSHPVYLRRQKSTAMLGELVYNNAWGPATTFTIGDVK